ncbi:MAG TPA: alpha/beta hydrolase [Candidatus Binatia bacterium]|nr:alpha/beta hydrolase [Candidatus Binatia bacterium]
MMKSQFLTTKRGCRVRVLEAGSGTPVVFLHGAGGLFAENPFLEALAKKYHVFAPELPGYGESTGEDLIEDMLDFTLHASDVIAELGIDKPHLIGHSMGGMIAAEMAATCPNDLRKLVLAGAAGLWIAEQPIPDLYAMLPHEYPKYLFHDPAAGLALLTGGLDFSNLEVLAEFYIANARRMAMAGKILFPIPNRRLSKRLYRIKAETLIVWGASDALIPPVYADRWNQAIAGSRLVQIREAGHMVPYEQPEVFVSAVSGFLG